MVLISDVCGGFGVGVEEVIEGGSASNAQLLTCVNSLEPFWILCSLVGASEVPSGRYMGGVQNSGLGGCMHQEALELNS